MTDSQSKEVELARSVVASASAAQREALLEWAIDLREIRSSTNAPIQKARLALKATAKKKVLAPILKANLKRAREVMWSERSWAARLAFIGLTIATLGFSGEAAGLAAFGRAISIPIWLVLTASGALLGTIIQELQQVAGDSAPSTTYSVIEAHDVTEP